MDTSSLINILQYLLPGFLAAWIFHGLTAYIKPSQFERVVQALIFTLLAQAGAFCFKSIFLWIGDYISIGNWGDNSDLFASLFCASVLGLTFAYCTNTDLFHKAARKIGLTKQTAYPSEWYGVFDQNITYVVLHLSDDRRLYGWPREWPDQSKVGHFALQDASWLTEDEKSIDLDSVDLIMIPADEVKYIEFMKKDWSNNDGQESS